MTTTTKKSNNNSNNSKPSATAKKAISLFESMTPTVQAETPTVQDLERQIKLSLSAFSLDDVFKASEMRVGLMKTFQTLRDHANDETLRPLMERMASILKGIHTGAKARLITALCEGDTRVVLPRDSVVDMIDDTFSGMDAVDVFYLATYCLPICDMIKQVLQDKPMVTVIPSVLYNARFTDTPLWERLPRVLNALIPFKQSGDWTCASKGYVRNSVQTWAVTQGAFIETVQGLFLIHSGLDKSMTLPTKEKRDARGNVSTVSKHTFTWVSKATRIVMYAKDTNQDLDALKAVCLAYGCSDSDWSAALDACKPKASGSASGKASGKGKGKKSQSLFDDIFGGLF